MESKFCNGCQTDKDIDEFAFKNRIKGTRQSRCHPCRQKGCKLSYEKHRDVTYRRNKRTRVRYKGRWDDFKRTQKCLFCPEIEPVCFDFHHIDPSQKDFNLGDMIKKQMSWDSLMEEVSKCICVCSNCHRKLHAGIISMPSW